MTGTPRPPLTEPYRLSTPALPAARMEPRSTSRALWLVLVIGLPIVLLLAAIPIVLASWPSPVSLSYSAAAGSAASVSVPNARFGFSPSTDGDVHVAVTGWSSGPAPKLTVATSGDTTTIGGGCSGAWFTRCDLAVRVELPAAAALTLVSTNGPITVTGLEGDIALGTTNGGLDLREVSGTLDLVTTNGAISVVDCTSGQVAVRTTNGAIDLRFSQAPTTVEATSTNGGVSVRVPDQVPYFIDAHTTNGPVNTEALPSDRFADRTITVSTTNGGILVEPSGR